MTVYSFASAQGMLPDEVAAELSADVRGWRTSGLSALALPFTGKDFADIAAAAEHDLRTLLAVPDGYRVLFLPGGASAQFALLPLNLLGAAEHADYVLSGHWSRRAVTEALAWTDVRVVATGDGRSLPEPALWARSADAAYCHFTSNETADGLQFHDLPEAVPETVPLVADMTADFLTRPLPVERFGIIYAGAQKSLAAAGLTLVIVRQDLLGRARRGTPAPFDYTRQAEARSRVSTPPTFPVLVARRMLAWLRRQGGLTAAAARSRARSAKLHAALDDGGFYRCPAAPAYRSSASVCFRLPSPALEQLFVTEADALGLVGLGGHPDVGGLRAALYNGLPDAAVDALAGFMADFRRRRG